MTTSFLPSPGSIASMSAHDLRASVVAGKMTARDVAEALLGRIAEVEDKIHAFAWHDPAHVLAQADALDAWQRTGRTLGPLHAVPVALKDIIETKGILTEYGSAVARGYVPDTNAAVVERLHAAGALVMGKTVTTELAFMHPGPTRNPLNVKHTPGGSSSGSAAAVAAGMVPLAVGTQTGGSVTRPASYCGIVGFKPSFGRISRRGVLPQSQSLDTVGVFARDPRDAAMLVEVLAGHDPADCATMGFERPLLAIADEGPGPKGLALALVRLPGVAEVHYAQLRDSLSDLPADKVNVIECELPDTFSQIAELRELINFAEMAHHYAWVQARGADAVSDVLRVAIEKGQAISATRYMSALAEMARARKLLPKSFRSFDAILSTATAGTAPEGLESTGTAICNGLWTYLGAASANLPMGVATSEGLRHGLQVTGPSGNDAQVLRVTQQLYGMTKTSVP